MKDFFSKREENLLKKILFSKQRSSERFAEAYKRIPVHGVKEEKKQE